MNESDNNGLPQPPVRGPLQGLVDVSDIVGEHPIHVGTFLRGVTIGALVGAALAGSAIWRRWRRRPDRPDRPDRE